IDILRIEDVRWAAACANERADQRHAQPVAAIEIRQAGDLEVLAEEQRPELVRLPGETVLHHGQRKILTVRLGQMKLPSRIELADPLRRPNAFCQSRIVK